jgi:apolipoprotein D and lipocalin family protein
MRSHVVLAALLLAGCAKSTTARLGLPPLETVETVDLERYMGLWHEQASFPQRFQEGCTATTATYTLRDDGQVDVLNQCHKGSPEGPLDTAEGRARLPDLQQPAKLEVSFFRPFWGDYWVIDLGPDYEYAVVGHPSRDYLWVLSREPVLEAGVYQGVLERLRAKGYPLERLERTVR